MAHSKTFYLQNGKVFSNLEKFAKELQSMEDEIFKHHVNKDKHDFKEWLHHSLKEAELAVKIQDKFSKLEIEMEVLRHIVHGTKKKATKKAPAKKKVATENKAVKKAPAKKKATTKASSKAKK